MNHDLVNMIKLQAHNVYRHSRFIG